MKDETFNHEYLVDTKLLGADLSNCKVEKITLLHFSPTLTTPKGLTRREYFAGMAMQGLLANRDYTSIPPHQFNFSYEAVQHADALIDELEKTK